MDRPRTLAGVTRLPIQAAGGVLLLKCVLFAEPTDEMEAAERRRRGRVLPDPRREVNDARIRARVRAVGPTWLP